MIKEWQLFEEECFNYLTKMYSPKFQFEKCGDSDSTVADIKVSTSKQVFFIEVKTAQAQSGQFVVLPDFDNKQFVFSNRNSSKENDSTKKIITYMNNNFDNYAAAGTSGKELYVSKEVFTNWIVDFYKLKGVKYVITKHNGYIIFPIDRFAHYFDITATYRIKKSGSSTPSQKIIPDLVTKINSLNGVDSIEIEGKKLFVHGSPDLLGHRLYVDTYEYLLQQSDKNIFEVRRLSNTNNANVIFSVNLKSEQVLEDLICFENEK